MLKPNEDLFAAIFNSRLLGGKRSKERIAPSYELELFHEGGGISHLGDEAFSASRGMLLCVKPGMRRFSDFPIRCSYVHIRSGVDPELDRILDAAPLCLRIRDEAQTERLLGRFSRLSALLLSAHASPESELLQINAELMLLLRELSGVWWGSEGVKRGEGLHRIVREGCAYIDLHYTESCTLGEIAAAVHASPSHVHATFVRELGRSPYGAVLDRRIRRARQLIAAGELSMLEIALQLGFCSQSHFNRIFKAETGQTPSAFRRALLSGC